MRRMYLDNAATSFPKPDRVHEGMAHHARQLGASPGRGAYHESKEAGRLLMACRQRLNRLIGGENPDHIIFTLNCSDALNLAIRGVLLNAPNAKPHVITTQMDHNSILRPLNKLQADGLITVTHLQADPNSGLVDPQSLSEAIRPETQLVATQHGSNVTGTLQDLKAMGAVVAEHESLFLVDAAQTLGHMPLDVQTLNVDLLAAPGHKGLLGPLGTGFLYIRPGVEQRMTTVREGGTGSLSELDSQPQFMPDRFESGSHNTIGLLGLSEGVGWILDRGVARLREHELKLMAAFDARLATLDTPGLHIYGPKDHTQRCAVYSIRIDGFKPEDLSNDFEKRFGLLTRSGLHCAPGAHTCIGTAKKKGTTRISFGPFLDVEDVQSVAESIAAVCVEAATAACEPTA